MQEYQQRMVTEKADLDAKTDKLSDFIMTDKFSGLPSDEMDRLARQLVCMIKYSEILGERITAF